MAKREEYQNFFLKTEAGKEFVAEVQARIAANHQAAESDPLLARDFTQRAKGNREILDHILSVTTPKKGGRTK